MRRKEFIRKSMLLGLAGAILPKAGSTASDTEKQTPNVGFNHLPNKEDKTMNTVLHKAGSRGHANHGWLDSHHTFSFANYYNPDRMHFGVLRVLNDDVVAPGKGFPTHPHDNMEIISIPLEGDLEHKDSMGNIAVIKEGDVQVMSAGKGVFHSEYNKNTDKPVKFLQIWLFPKTKNVEPRYDQVSIRDLEKPNQLSQVLSPNPESSGVWIHQDAWFSIGRFTEKTDTVYNLHASGNGVYLFVLDGNVTVEGQDLESRDGFGIWDTEEVHITAQPNSRILAMEVPMTLS